MPAITTCPHCGFYGLHGFAPTFPYTTHFYHSINGPAGTVHSWYEGVDKKIFLTKEEAARAVTVADPRYDELWFAYIMDPLSKTKVVRLHKKRCNGEPLTAKDLEWLRSKGYSERRNK